MTGIAKGGPVRMCAGCRGRAGKAELIRVVARNGVGVVDEAQTAPGRGVYLHPRPDCLEQAVKRRSMGRLLRAEIDGARTAEALRVHLDALT
ncbi:MAG TPA: YlxR family protein [Propionibacteriaceae bacterium]|nr:YlxR family protein [Propionibacteriaceae bacterium]